MNTTTYLAAWLNHIIRSKDSGEVSIIGIRRLVPARTLYQARPALMIIKILYSEGKIHGMTGNNPKIGVKPTKRREPKRVFLTWHQVNALDRDIQPHSRNY